MIDGGPLAVLSPHLDDAVFACGELLSTRPGALVITLFAGRPSGTLPLMPWDAASGFSPGDDVIGLRREEDRSALARLGAQPLWLDFLDAQYAPSPEPEQIASALDGVLSGTNLDTVYVPLGLFHSDHALTHTAALRLLRRRPEFHWFAYEDAIYRGIDQLLSARLRQLAGDGVVAAPAGASSGGHLGQKRRAIACYRSQLRALRTPGRPGYADALLPERYWRLRLAVPARSTDDSAAPGQRA